MLDAALRDLSEPAPGLRLGCSVIRDGREEVTAGSADEALRTASVGKVLLLLTVAGLLASRELDGSEVLTRRGEDAVGDSGVWQHLEQSGLPVRDLAWLVGAVSDNLATNVLLRRVGLEAVDRTRIELGLSRTHLERPGPGRSHGRRSRIPVVGVGAGALRSVRAVADRQRPPGPDRRRRGRALARGGVRPVDGRLRVHARSARARAAGPRVPARQQDRDGRGRSRRRRLRRGPGRLGELCGDRELGAG